MSLPTFTYANGRRFVAEELVPTGKAWWESLDEDELRTYVATCWQEAYEAKRAEIERLKLCSLYYDGFHYQTAWLNRTNPIFNYCFSTVETVVPMVTEVRPRPEIVPRGSMNPERIYRLQEFAGWLMDRDHFDDFVVASARDKSIYGWNMTLISFDFKSGLPYPKPLSVFDYYGDPSARTFDDATRHVLGSPVSTADLQARFPAYAERIQPDNLTSPAYDVHVRPWFEYLENAHRFDTPTAVSSSLHFAKESEPTPTSGTALAISTGGYREHGHTSFLIQVLVRDDTLRPVTYIGTEYLPDGEEHPGMHLEDHQASSKSGWVVIRMTAGGVILGPPEPLDDCYGGINLVMGRRYPRSDRYWSPGDLDHVIPGQREINRRRKGLARALDLAANPPIVTNVDSGLRSDQSTVEAGEILRIARGSDVKWLEFRGPGQQHFEMLGVDQRDLDTISGVHDVTQGQRPAGIEAAAAIRRLQEAAAVRIRGMENPAHRERALVLKKLMLCAGRKLRPSMMFKATNGSMLTVDHEDLLQEYDIQFAYGTGTVNGRADYEEKAFALFDRGAIDEPALLEAMNWKGRDEIAARIMQMKLAEMEINARAQADALKNGGAPGQSSGGRQPAGRR